MMRRLLLLGLIVLTTTTRAADSIDAVAQRYAHLVLALGQHDPDYVDAFYVEGAQTEKEKKSLDAIGAEAAEPIAILAKTPDATTGSWKAVLTAPPFPHITLAPKVRTITHLPLRFLRRSIKTN